MRRRRVPPSEITHYRAAKAAAGGSGAGGGGGRGRGSGGGGDGLRPGQNVICKIAKAEPGGYAVIIPKYNLPGYLPSNARHNIGDEVLATFVCLDKGRVLLADRFTHVKNERRGDTSLNWEEYLDELISEPSTRMRYQCRRAIDLIMQPLDTDSLRSMCISDYDVEWLITQLVGGQHTGAVKVSCESELSRGAILLYKGRAVGGIYGCKSDPVTKPTEDSLLSTLETMKAPDTVVAIYDLPEDIVLAMSSLFLGYPVERHDDYSAREYLDYICNWLAQKSGTGTLAISTRLGRTYLVYIYSGEHLGTFSVDDQTYCEDEGLLREILKDNPRSNVEVSILPPEMTAEGVLFGFNLYRPSN